MATTGASNPLRFLAGHFDGTDVTGILNASAMSALVEPVPATIALGLDVDENALFAGDTLSSFAIDWQASAPAKVEFDYLESESTPDGTPDYNTVLTVEDMPTSEQLSVSLIEGMPTQLMVSHTANAVIDTLTILHERDDGLVINATATDVPTAVDLTIDPAGSAVLDVNANTLDLQIVATQEGGFASSSAFLGYPMGYAELRVVNAPDLSAMYDPTDDSITVAVTNPGEEIELLEFLIGDDDNLELPPGAPAPWDDFGRHVFSLVDNGTHGTAAARILHLANGTLQLDATDIGEAYVLTTNQAAPLTAYLRTETTSNLIPGHDIEATCEIQDVPAGTLDFEIDFPTSFSYTTNPPSDIDSVSCAGHIDDTNFDVDIGGLPPEFSFDFDPDGSLTVVAGDGFGGPATVGHVAVRLWNDALTGLPGSGGLLGTPLNDARARVDDIPSFHATWSDGVGATAIDFNTDADNAFLGGAQIALSTIVELVNPLAEASGSSDHYLTFEDEGNMNRKKLTAGAFGIDEFSYSSDDMNLTLHYDSDSAPRTRRID